MKTADKEIIDFNRISSSENFVPVDSTALVALRTGYYVHVYSSFENQQDAAQIISVKQLLLIREQKRKHYSVEEAPAFLNVHVEERHLNDI